MTDHDSVADGLGSFAALGVDDRGRQLGVPDSSIVWHKKAAEEATVDGATIANLAIAGLALVISATTAVRQLLVTKNANHLEASWQVLRETAGDLFLDCEEFISGQLAAAHSPTCGISGLPEPARSKVRRVAYAYQTIAYLASLRAIDRKMVRYLVGLRVVSAWRSLAPYIDAERQDVNSAVGFRFFEDLAVRCADLTPAGTISDFHLRSFDRGA